MCTFAVDSETGPFLPNFSLNVYELCTIKCNLWAIPINWCNHSFVFTIIICKVKNLYFFIIYHITSRRRGKTLSFGFSFKIQIRISSLSRRVIGFCYRNFF